METELIDKSVERAFYQELSLDDYVCKVVQYKLDKYKNIVKTAKAIKIGKSTIYKLISEGKVKKPI